MNKTKQTVENVNFQLYFKVIIMMEQAVNNSVASLTEISDLLQSCFNKIDTIMT